MLTLKIVIIPAFSMISKKIKNKILEFYLYYT